jgi:hypothetical protein
MSESLPAPDVLVIANCHCLPIADALALCGMVGNTEFIDAVTAHEPHMQEKIARLGGKEGGDLVFTFPLSEKFGPLATAALRPIYGERLRTFTNIHFFGLHPDITYLGPMRGRVEGYFGPYHSKLVLFAFVNGRSEAECRDMFTGEVFRRIGYFHLFDISADELRGREPNCDIKFAETFLEMAVREPVIYTFNHFSGKVFLELAGALARDAGIAYIPHGPQFFQHHLSESYIWPIYDEIAEEHKLAYRTGQHFIRAAGRQRRSVTLDEFIAGSYAAYRAADPEEFTAMVRDLEYYPHMLHNY